MPHSSWMESLSQWMKSTMTKSGNLAESKQEQEDLAAATRTSSRYSCNENTHQTHAHQHSPESFPLSVTPKPPTSTPPSSSTKEKRQPPHFHSSQGFSSSKVMPKTPNSLKSPLANNETPSPCLSSGFNSTNNNNNNNAMNRLYPSLMGSNVSMEHLHIHIPRAARCLLLHHKIDTIGKLASMSIDRIQKIIPLQDSVFLMMQALIKYETRVKQNAAAHARKLYCSPIKTPPSSFHHSTGSGGSSSGRHPPRITGKTRTLPDLLEEGQISSVLRTPQETPKRPKLKLPTVVHHLDLASTTGMGNTGTNDPLLHNTPVTTTPAAIIWCSKTKAIRHLEKGIHYIEQYKGKEQQDERAVNQMKSLVEKLNQIIHE